MQTLYTHITNSSTTLMGRIECQKSFDVIAIADYKPIFKKV